MSDDTKKAEFRQDDIDLLALLERSISFFKKNKWIFFSAILVGLLLGFLRYRSLPVVYKSRMVMQSIVLTNQNDIQIVAHWDAVLKSGDYPELFNIFNLDKNILQKVKQIKAEEIQKIFTPNNPNGFTIDVMVTDYSILKDLQKGIVYAFDNCGYIKDRLVAKRNRLQELIDKTSIELQKLDSTKKLVENILNGKVSRSSSLIIDASSINQQWIDMNERLLTLKEELKFCHAVEVLHGFGKFKNPAGPNLYAWLFSGLIACLSIAYVLALFRSINQKLRNRTTHRKET